MPTCPLACLQCVPAESSHDPFPSPSLCRLILEDEGARLQLCGDALPVGECTTGVVAAVRGRVQPNGDFEVSDVCFAGLPPQAPLPVVEEK